MPKFIIDQNVIDNEFKMLNNILKQQRNFKKTLLLYLEKISDSVCNVSNPENTDSLISCLNEIKEVFETTKNNIDKTKELKTLLQNITKSEHLSSFDFEKYNESFINLFNDVSKNIISFYSLLKKLIKYINIVFPEYNSKELLELLKTYIPQIQYQTDDFEKTNFSCSFEDSEINNTDKNLEEKIQESIKAINEDLDKTVKEKINHSTNINIENNPDSINKNLDTIINENINCIDETIDKILKDNIDSINESFNSVINNINENTEKISENNIDSVNQNLEDIADENVSIINNDQNKFSENTIDSANQNLENVADESVNTINDNFVNSSKKDICDDYFSSDRTLYIDEKLQKAILPYSISELENFFSNNPEKYSSIQDIIDKEYTVSLNDYKNTAFSRFTETYKLAKEKSNLSFFDAINSANQLFSDNLVNPIIIAACQNMKELNCYLDCLHNNNLNDFKYFKIIKNSTM